MAHSHSSLFIGVAAVCKTLYRPLYSITLITFTLWQDHACFVKTFGLIKMCKRSSPGLWPILGATRFMSSGHIHIHLRISARSSALYNVGFQDWHVLYGSVAPMAPQVIFEMLLCYFSIHADAALLQQLCSNSIQLLEERARKRVPVLFVLQLW